MAKRESISDDDEVGVSASLQKLIDDLEDRLRIDKHALDDELMEQPQLFYDASKELVLSMSRRDAAKQNVQVMEARADADIRRDAAKAGDKITEKEVEASKKLDRDVIRANEELMRLNHEVALLGALKDAFQQRASALRGMTDLYSANYYSSASAGGSERRLRNVHGEEAREAMRAERRKGAK